MVKNTNPAEDQLGGQAMNRLPVKGNLIRVVSPEGIHVEGTVTYTSDRWGETELLVQLENGNTWEPTFFLADPGEPGWTWETVTP
jgi:hypothetical protein